MQSLGLMPMKAIEAQPIAAAAGTGKGVKLAVLGGGVGGLVTAYEAKKLGYDVTLLEARHRPGGRAWSARGGDVVEFVDGTKQTVAWSDGLYQNMGHPCTARCWDIVGSSRYRLRWKSTHRALRCCRTTR
jgi:monoamine oxidase